MITCRAPAFVFFNDDTHINVVYHFADHTHRMIYVYHLFQARRKQINLVLLIRFEDWFWHNLFSTNSILLPYKTNIYLSTNVKKLPLLRQPLFCFGPYLISSLRNCKTYPDVISG